MKTANRLLYLDWMRGIAAIIMLQGHVFHSFLRNDLRSGGPYVFSQFLGGMPPAVFLFLTGITLSFLMDSHERKGVTTGARYIAALRRAGYLLAVAFAFRIQLWSFSRIFSSSHNPWQEMLKVDILNCMGFGIALLSVMAVFTTMERIRLCAVLGCAIAFLSPLVTQAGAGMWPPLLRDYIVPSYNYFAFFPWAAFIAFGMSIGSILRVARQEQMTQLMQWLALGGIGLAFGSGVIAGAVPAIYTRSEFWLDGPQLIFMKLGVLLIVVAFSYVWMMQASAQGWSWVRQLGITSLLVYWVHIELVYGHWLGWMKLNLGVGQTLLAALAIIVLMVLLSSIRTAWPGIRVAVTEIFSSPHAEPAAAE